MSLFLSFDISGAEPREINRERYTTEKERLKLVGRAKTDQQLAPPGAKFLICEVGKEFRLYPLEDE
ncbi:MAG TPA: hypothetical protein VN372_05255 [Methanospirillum sp.]|nr:hypothetical protein [Methanospirillum sp.]